MPNYKSQAGNKLAKGKWGDPAGEVTLGNLPEQAVGVNSSVGGGHELQIFPQANGIITGQLQSRSQRDIEI